MRRFQIITGTILLLAAVAAGVWFFAVEKRRPGLAGQARFATRVMGVAITGAVGLGLLRSGLAMRPRGRPPEGGGPPEDDERAGW